MTDSLFIDNRWQAGGGADFASHNPATGEVVWEGKEATAEEVDTAAQAASNAFPTWAVLSFEQRLAYAERFRDIATKRREELAETISRETGKTRWEATGEAGIVLGKIAVAVQSYHDRTGEKSEQKEVWRQELRHRPLGVMAVFGPFNFPAHLPNGHIVPALLAGNTVVLKPSELTPATGELLVRFWEEAGLPAGVLNLVQGGRETGVALAANRDLAGILFTGSYATGKKLHEGLAGRPEIMLALEMGGNNPLIVHEAEDATAAALLTIQSAYLTSGQRCTCARRLVVPECSAGDAFIEALLSQTRRIRVGAYTEDPEPFMGPLVSNPQADNTLHVQESLRQAGGDILLEATRLKDDLPFLSPGLIDVTAVPDKPDAECFGPLLQLVRVPDFDAAITEANNTAYGLSAALLSNNPARWEQFRSTIRAGIVNWNRPTTGAVGTLPFGGPGHSGNLRPSAYYAADYCAYPVATLAVESVEMTEVQGLGGP